MRSMECVRGHRDELTTRLNIATLVCVHAVFLTFNFCNIRRAYETDVALFAIAARLVMSTVLNV